METRPGFGKRDYTLMALLFMSVGWLLFKLFYIHPNLVYDSYAYIHAAAKGLGFNAWPIGYSKFIQVFSFFSHSANLLVSIQYFILEISCLAFFHAWQVIFRPGRGVSIFVFLCLFANPALLYISNFILSDALFITLSVLWVAQLLWMLYRPKPYMVFTHALLLAGAFTVRYNALYYPFIGGACFMLSGMTMRQKIAGIAFPTALIGAFVIYTGGQVAKVTGQSQFSPFGAWKLANDALYVYARVPDDLRVEPPERFRSLDSIVKVHFVNEPFQLDMNADDPSSGSYFMLDSHSPLKKFITFRYRRTNWGYKEWLGVAPLYQDYGFYLIRQYPLFFSKYFVWPNFTRYLIPPAEIFDSELPFQLRWPPDPNTSQLFHLETLAVDPSLIKIIRSVVLPFRYILFASHLVFMTGMLIWIFCDRCKRRICNYLLVIGGLWLFDLIFSVLSAGVVLRYQLFMMIVEVPFGVYLIARSIEAVRTYRKRGVVAVPAGSQIDVRG